MNPQVQTSPSPPRSDTTGAGWFLGAGLGRSTDQGACDGTLGAIRPAVREWVIPSECDDPLGELARILDTERAAGSAWAIMLSYKLGERIEPKASSRVEHTLPFPSIVVQQLGSPAQIPCSNDASDAQYELGRLSSHMGRERYIAAVERVLEYIAAGDIYQANIAHHLEGSFVGSPLACARALLSGAQPRYGGAMGFDYEGRRHMICSVSPELFLRYDAQSREVRTEPMKGTRPLGADCHEFEQSPKDRAELNMITDLMRNDLGRVCALGSVRVSESRKIEPHASSVLQASSVVHGTLREGFGIAELIGATFPPGSVTGAPKVRAMQIIDELEDRPRNSYCGSLLYLDPDGGLTGSVSIRTAHIWGAIDPNYPDRVIDGRLNYPIGAGIVADSDPQSEWAETLMKAAVLRSVLGADIKELGEIDP